MQPQHTVGLIARNRNTTIASFRKERDTTKKRRGTMLRVRLRMVASSLPAPLARGGRRALSTAARGSGRGLATTGELRVQGAQHVVDAWLCEVAGVCEDNVNAV